MRGSDPCPAAGMAKHRRGCGLPPPLSAIAGELRRARTRVQLVHHLRGSWSSTIGARRCECSGVAVPGAPSRSRGNYCGHIRAHDPACLTKRQRGGTRASNCIAQRPEQQQTKDQNLSF
ncbi:uncharacterized protein LOC110429823 [Sorghum bicolor]|uniref:uncharacterized protein LOC110429823 n=1 Tax=Sorghum bicolor TaxID=4558 RepID=UPI000B4267B6|nr:uncharacterized protein LOC110429823 [Sorghum bicolor]|eukprot:XP_021302158.1 uncharacterized protein LOC110429823 [Sorghum bicolor]